MIVIHRGKEPSSLLKYRKSSTDACYEELPKEAVSDIRKQMWGEQKGLCAYCMKRIDAPEDVRIEHYNARHPHSGYYHAKDTLDFRKMLAVCYGNSFRRGNPDEQTCDAHKGNMPLTVDPFDITSIRKSKSHIVNLHCKLRKVLRLTVRIVDCCRDYNDFSMLICQYDVYCSAIHFYHSENTYFHNFSHPSKITALMKNTAYMPPM